MSEIVVMGKRFGKTYETNKELNKLDIYINKPCPDCGRKYPDTILNIEGHIHHSTRMICIDRQSCERLKRKRKIHEIKR